MTTHSFVDENDDFVVGAIIDKSDTEATDIMNDINQNTPSVLSYIKNWRDYDYKGSGEKVEKYRGRITPSGEIASMRDVGNYVAGYVAGKANVPLTFARIAFERLQATNNMKDITNIFGDGKESTNSVMAQNKGWLEGYKEQLSMKTGVTYD